MDIDVGAIVVGGGVAAIGGLVVAPIVGVMVVAASVGALVVGAIVGKVAVAVGDEVPAIVGVIVPTIVGANVFPSNSPWHFCSRGDTQGLIPFGDDDASSTRLASIKTDP